MAQFDTVVILPNVATEVNNLLGKLRGSYRTVAHQILAHSICEWQETYVTSQHAVAQREFMWLGITDAAIILAAVHEIQVATDDLNLYRALMEHRAAVVNFTHIRTKDWLQTYG